MFSILTIMRLEILNTHDIMLLRIDSFLFGDKILSDTIDNLKTCSEKGYINRQEVSLINGDVVTCFSIFCSSVKYNL